MCQGFDEAEIFSIFECFTKTETMHRKLLTCLLLALLTSSLSAQSGDDVYQFLNIPASVSAAGVGGNSVSSAEKDLNLTFHNPAILSVDMNKELSVGYMRYISDINIGTAAFAHKLNEKSMLMLGIRYVDYGSMLWTTPEDDILGNTYAQDFALTGTYSFMLSEKWRAGANLSIINSSLDEYNSVAIATDLGLYYKDPIKNFSAGFVIKSLGSQIVSYDQTYEKMPFDVQLGLSKKLAHAPIRFTLTAQNLTEIDLAYLRGDSTTNDPFVAKLFKHITGGVEFIPSDNFLLSLGYNYRRSSELNINQRTAFGGFTAGFSMKVKKIRVGASFAKYHISGSTLQMSLSTNLANF